MANFNSSGIRHPNTFSISQGKTLYSSKLNSINQSISLILRTAKGELFGDPEFGSNLYTYLFDSIKDTHVEDLIRDEIVTSINKYEPRVFVEADNISFEYEENTVKINIMYNLRYTDIVSDYQYIIRTREGEV